MKQNIAPLETSIDDNTTMTQDYSLFDDTFKHTYAGFFVLETEQLNTGSTQRTLRNYLTDGYYASSSSGSAAGTETTSARFRRGSFMVVAGRLRDPCSASATLDLFVPNNVEPSTIVSTSLSSDLSINKTGFSSLALGASYDRVLPRLLFDNDSMYTWQNLDLRRDSAEFDGAFKRFIFSKQDDPTGEVIAAAACELAQTYNIVDYGTSLVDRNVCELRPDTTPCISDSQCSSNNCLNGICSASTCPDECSNDGVGCVTTPVGNFLTGQDCIQDDLVYLIDDGGTISEVSSTLKSDTLKLSVGVASITDDSCDSDFSEFIDVARYTSGSNSFM